MQQEYKELFITDDMNIAREAKKEGRYVVLCYPLKNELPDDNFSDYPYAIERGDVDKTDTQLIEKEGIDWTVELDTEYLDHILCRFQGIPCDILDTERCHIREITTEDVDTLYEIYKEPQITRFMENLYENREDEIAYTKDYIKYQYGFYDYGMWIVESKAQIIGRAGFDRREGYEEPELGFMIRREFQQQGYATEICEALLKYGKEQLGFTKVGAFTEKDNIASVRLLRKLGFEYQQPEYVKTVKTDGEILDYYSKCL